MSRQKKPSLGLLDEATTVLQHAAPETVQGADRVTHNQESLEKREGFGATAAGQAIAERWLLPLKEGIDAPR